MKPAALQQPAKLNRLVDRTIPWTWATRREVFAPYWPIILLTGFFLSETALLKLWTTNQLDREHAWLPPVSFALVVGLMFLGIEATARCQHWQKRTLRLDKRGIILDHHNRRLIRWRRISALRLEPVAGEPGLKKLTLERWLGKPGRSPFVRWSMVLQHPAQTDQLRQQLAALPATGDRPQLLQDLPAALPERPRPRLSGLGWLAVAMLLFFHGIPLVMAGLGLRPPETSDQSEVSPAASVTVQKGQVAGHFADRDRYHHVCLATGLGLMGLAALCYVRCGRRPDSAPEASASVPCSGGL